MFLVNIENKHKIFQDKYKLIDITQIELLSLLIPDCFKINIGTVKINLFNNLLNNMSRKEYSEITDENLKRDTYQYKIFIKEIKQQMLHGGMYVQYIR